jgi:SDR family mycofactocin-dependent oxidoreductase
MSTGEMSTGEMSTGEMSTDSHPSSTDQRPLNGRVAVVTGAARGQGRSHCVRLAIDGAAIVAIDSCHQPTTTDYGGATVDDLQRTHELVVAQGVQCRSVVVDVRNLTELTACVAAACNELGAPRVVVANAGIAGGAPIEMMTGEAWIEMIDTNLTGVWNTLKATVPMMLAAGEGGSVIVISSANGGLKAPANLAHYAAAKHGVVGIVKSLANELGPRNVRVNSIHPTAVDTDMIHNDFTYRLFRPDLASPTRHDVVELFESFHSLPIAWIDAVDVSEAVAFLASDATRYITGIALPIDAGLSAR